MTRKTCSSMYMAFYPNAITVDPDICAALQSDQDLHCFYYVISDRKLTVQIITRQCRLIDYTGGPWDISHSPFSKELGSPLDTMFADSVAHCLSVINGILTVLHKSVKFKLFLTCFKKSFFYHHDSKCLFLNF